MFNNKMRKVAIFSANLNVGGIQKSLVNIMKSGALNDCEVDVFLFSDEVFYDISNIPSNITLNFLKPLPFIYKLMPFGVIYRFFRPDFRVLEKDYDVAIDFDSYQHSTALGALKAHAKKRIMWIHNDVQIKIKEEKKYALLFKLMRSKYKYFSEFVAVSDGIVNPFREASGCHSQPIYVIPNFIDADSIISNSMEDTDIKVDPNKLNIVSVGRLCHQKAYDIMLPEIKKVYDERKDIACYLVGDGPEREALERQVKALGLEDIVMFTGNLKNPFPIVRQMDAFCLMSRYEGQGMVLWEAKALGLQLVFSKHLEKYNKGLRGVESIANTLINLQKTHKEFDHLEDYNNNIFNDIKSLLCN